MESNMVGVASGLSLVGDIPFIHTFSPFATRRDFDQVFLSGAYAKTNIKILGSDPGIYAQHNGGTHTSFEDIALMRTIPTAVVMSISDTTMMKNIFIAPFVFFFQLLEERHLTATRTAPRRPKVDVHIFSPEISHSV